MSYRKFWMTNGKSETVYFAEETSSIYLNNPVGMGVSNNISTNQYGQKLSLVKVEQGFGGVGGEILFYKNGVSDKYDKYNDFIEFLTYEPLEFFYQIPLSTPETYSMDVTVSSIDKTEVKTDGMMRCNFTLQGLSRWKGAKVEATGTTNSYSLVNNSHMPVGFLIAITGTSMENPYFTLSNDDGLYGEAKFIGVFDKVTVNSRDAEQEVVVEAGGSVLPNPLSYQDLSISNGSIYVTFVKLARGTSTLAIGMDSGTLTKVDIEYVPLYRSV